MDSSVWECFHSEPDLPFFSLWCKHSIPSYSIIAVSWIGICFMRYYSNLQSIDKVFFYFCGISLLHSNHDVVAHRMCILHLNGCLLLKNEFYRSWACNIHYVLCVRFGRLSLSVSGCPLFLDVPFYYWNDALSQQDVGLNVAVCKSKNCLSCTRIIQFN